MDNLTITIMLFLAACVGVVLLLMYLQYRKNQKPIEVNVENMPTIPTPLTAAVTKYPGDTENSPKGGVGHLEALATEYYSQYMKGTHSGRVSLSDKASLNVVMNILKQKFHKVTVVYRDIQDKEEGTIFLECTNIASMIEYKAYVGLWWNLKSCDEYTSKNGDWNMRKHASLKQEGKDFQMVVSSVIIYPDPTKQTSIKEESFKLAIEQARVKRIDRKIEEAKFYNLVKSTWGYNLVAMGIPGDWNLRKEELDTNYGNTHMGFKAKFDRYNIDKVLFIAVQFLLHGKSVALNGVFGPGKSRLLFHIAHLLGQKEDVKIVNTTAATLSQLFESGTDVSKILVSGFKYILLCDEMDDILEENESLFKNLCDGTLGKMYNVCMLFTFNKIIDNYESSMYRPGRVLLVEPKPMNKEDAFKVVKRLSSKEEEELTGKVFDTQLYMDRIHNNEKVTEVTLAVVYDFLEDFEEIELEKKMESMFNATEKETVVSPLPTEVKVPASVMEPAKIKLVRKPQTRT